MVTDTYMTLEKRLFFSRRIEDNTRVGSNIEYSISVRGN